MLSWIKRIFEERPGLPSSTRFAIAWLLVLATILVETIRTYVLSCKPDAAVVGAIVTGLSVLVVQGAVAIWKRTRKGEPPSP